MLKLHIEERNTKTAPAAIRAEGKIPAVLYGRKEESTPISVDYIEFMKVLNEAGESTIIELDGVNESKEALIHDIDVNVVTDKAQHVDFYIIEKGKKLTVDVALEFVGVSPAVKSLGGTLVKVVHEIEIEALPKDLPHEIEVDISALVDFETTIAIKDIKLPEGVVALGDPDEAVALVSAPKEIEEEEAPTAIDMDAIQVEEKGKKEEVSEGEEKPSE